MNIEYSKHPKAIELQTASFCNSFCTICPYSESSIANPRGVMTEELFNKIIDQISIWDRPKIIPYFNNEPFLDPLLFKRLEYIAANCPDPDIEISTNMSMLDAERQAKLSRFRLSELRMSVFGFSEIAHKKIMRGLNWSKVKENLDNLAANDALRSKIGIISIVVIEYPGIDKSDVEKAKEYCAKNGMIFEFWGFLDRGGNVKQFSNAISRGIVRGCEQRRPLDRLHVTFDGNVVLCCMDWFSRYILGNLNTQSIEDVWNSEKYNQIRRLIYSGSAQCPELCKHCKLAI